MFQGHWLVPRDDRSRNSGWSFLGIIDGQTWYPVADKHVEELTTGSPLSYTSVFVNGLSSQFIASKL